MAELMDYLTQAVERRASDLFFVAGGSASAKVEGQILPLDDERLLPPKTEELLRAIYQLAGRDMDGFLARGDDDFSFSVRGLARFRSPGMIGGLLLNGCSRGLAELLTPMLQRETGLPVLGWLPQLPDCAIASRHLGLLTPGEVQGMAEKVDRLVLGHFRDGVFWNEDGSWSFSAHYNYTWIWSSLTFGATVMLGAFAGKIMKAGKDNRRKVVQTLLIIGISLIAFSLIWSLQMPIIKRLWTSSMTLFSGGLCFLLMGAFYYRIDYKGHSRGLNWLKIYGMNSITAYILGEVINFRCIAASVSYGLEQYLGGYYQVWLSFANYLIVFLILRIMYRQKIFLKI